MSAVHHVRSLAVLCGCAAATCGVRRKHQLLLAVRCTDMTEYADKSSERLNAGPTTLIYATCHGLRLTVDGEAVVKHAQHTAAQARKQSFPSAAQLLSLLPLLAAL